jgi:hypothetical protein
VVDVAKITHGELDFEGMDDRVEEYGGVGGKNDIINIKQQICNGRAMPKNK